MTRRDTEVGPRRSREHLTTALVITICTGLLIWYGAVVLSASSTSVLPENRAAQFVPGDSDWTAITFSQGDLDGNGMIENARLSFSAIIFAMSATAAKAMQQPAGGWNSAVYWREATVPADLKHPTRFRIRTVEPGGIFLRIQDWAQLGLSFENLLELPADVHAGQTWTSAGRALGDPTSRQLYFRNSSTAAAPEDPELAGAGCLRVASATVLATNPGGAGERWQESSLWCPGRGVVQQSGTLRGTAYEIAPNTEPLGRVAVETLTSPDFDTSSIGSWSHRTEKVLGGDQTFGEDPAPDVEVAATPLVAANGVIAYPYANTNDLVMLQPLTAGSHWQHWYGRPGGAITSSSVVGSLVLVAGTDRTLRAYNAGGRLRWASALDDVAVAAPVALSPTRLGVATVGGTLTVLDATSGEQAWSRPTGGSIHNPIAGNTSVVVAADVDGRLAGYDATTGEPLWSSDNASAFGSAISVDESRVYSTSSGFLTAQDLRTGRLLWTRHVGYGLGSLARSGSDLLVQDGSTLVARSPIDGSERWQLAGTDLAGAAVGSCLPPAGYDGVSFALRGTEVVAFDHGGVVAERWPVQAPIATVRALHCAAGRVWLSAWTEDGSRGLTLESIGAS